MSKDDFKKFWEMIPKANETQFTSSPLFSVFTQGDVSHTLVEGMRKNGFENVAKVQKQQ